MKADNSGRLIRIKKKQDAPHATNRVELIPLDAIKDCEATKMSAPIAPPMDKLGMNKPAGIFVLTQLNVKQNFKITSNKIIEVGKKVDLEVKALSSIMPPPLISG